MRGTSPAAPVVISISSESAVLLRGSARALGVEPAQLGRALMHKVLFGDQVQAVLDGDAPEALALSTGRGAKGLTYLRCAILYLAALHAGPDGVCRHGTRAMAALVSGPGWTTEPADVSAAARFLQRRGLLLIDGATLRLTEDGQRVAAALGDLDFCAGGLG